jgi:hypothetical protein
LTEITAPIRRGRRITAAVVAGGTAHIRRRRRICGVWEDGACRAIKQQFVVDDVPHSPIDDDDPPLPLPSLRASGRAGGLPWSIPWPVRLSPHPVMICRGVVPGTSSMLLYSSFDLPPLLRCLKKTSAVLLTMHKDHLLSEHGNCMEGILRTRLSVSPRR